MRGEEALMHEQPIRPIRAGWMSIPDRMAQHAARDPHALAVTARGVSLTYGELTARVDALAAGLQAVLGDDDNRLIAVCLDRTVDLSAWLLALLKIGAAYLPIDPTLPPARIAQVLEDGRPAFILVSRGMSSFLPPTDLRVIVAEDQAAAPPRPLGRCDAGPHSLAYVIYTSGSTGRPKGVEIEQGAVVALLDAILQMPGFADGQRLMGLTRISFDLSVVDMFMPFYGGGELIMIDLDEAADPGRLADAFDRHRPDFVQATPSTWRALLEWGWQGCFPLRLLCGGEAMTRDLADRLIPRCTELWNVYGPTETTVWSTAYRVVPGSGVVPIGAPITGTSIRIADHALVAVEQGSTGEIVIGGPSVARGYRGNPALTAERFVALDTGERAYRTGDIGRVDEHGLIHCLGRLDDQVKVRGFRVELGDVEAALAAHPGISWSAARVWPDDTGETVLVGYVVARNGGALPTADVRAFLAELVPPYMIPSRIVPMTVMPLTPNGKVDRAGLPNPLRRVAGRLAEPVADNGIERRLAAIWSDLLGVDDIGRGDDFFDLGGYSLITVRLLRRIRQEFGRTLELGQLMQDSTLAGMAALVATDVAPTSVPTLLNGTGANPGDQRVPLFWLDAGPLIRGVARGMSSDQPVLGINLTRQEEDALNGNAVDLSAVAALLCRRLCEAQPDGPLFIAGWCRWGVVAYEVACQLRERGRELGLLVLLDATVHRSGAGQGTGSLALFRRLLGRSASGSLSGEERSFSQQVERAAQTYVPRFLDADVLLVRPTEAERGAADGGWLTIVARGRLHVRRSPGNHVTMVRAPYAETLAQVIDRALLDMQHRLAMRTGMVVMQEDTNLAARVGAGADL